MSKLHPDDYYVFFIEGINDWINNLNYLGKFFIFYVGEHEFFYAIQTKRKLQKTPISIGQ